MMDERNLAAIGEFETELRYRLCRQNDEDRLFSDLTGLFVDIINVIATAHGGKWETIYDYAKLLEQELQLYKGADAYIAGQESKGKPENEVINAYVCRIAEVKNGQRLESRIQACFDEIIGLLGDKSGLITEFTETYYKVHGMVKNNIHEFIRLGQTA